MPNALAIKRVVVAPLDWGLGHATRCIPIVNEFLRQGCDVQIASSGAALVLLREEFPSLKFHSLVSYRAEYSTYLPFILKMIIQVPKFLNVIRKEHAQMEKIAFLENIDLIISDNRYGCWSEKTKNIFVGHQLILMTPVFSSFINYLHQKAIKRFSPCWVPDVAGKESLTGELSINTNLKPKYVGVLSRMRWNELPIRYKILVIISGPEPQRSVFEKLVLNELKTLRKKCLVIRGIPGQTERTLIDQVEIVNYMNSQEMNNAILESEIIISRSGYSTIMDLAMLGKQAIFVPTPGQFEQQYLAEELMKKKIAFSMRQDNFNLPQALSKVSNYTGFVRRKENMELSETIKDLLDETN